MVEISRILVFMSCWIALIKCQMEPFVVGGEKATITHFPHSVFMYLRFVYGNADTVAWICGASIVNQNIVLTAAHCVFGYSNKSVITVFVGHVRKYKGLASTVASFMIHERYKDISTKYDIALLKLKTLIKFGKNVKRIALMKNPPYYEKAQIAGWGLINEIYKTMAINLKYVDQYVWTPTACKQVIRNVPKGTICASSRDSDSYSSRGDSGSALVVRGYIQIGLVSYKMPSISRSLVVYTDTGYFYDWIKKNSKKLYCVVEQA